jgi:hypothetical protein
MEFRNESWIMKFLGGVGLTRYAWALRRLHCPVNKDALVLDVGLVEIPMLVQMYFWMPMRKHLRGITQS